MLKMFKSYCKNESALSVENIVFIVVGLIVAILIGWYLFNLVSSWANKGTDADSRASDARSKGSEFSGGLFN